MRKLIEEVVLWEGELFGWGRVRVAKLVFSDGSTRLEPQNLHERSDGYSEWHTVDDATFDYEVLYAAVESLTRKSERV
jgi:hypothetical protein